ncbi:GNAT family N-acetyltransferase [Pontibacter mangrovi]|uniref:GNAT family N-acetyltransferase n=1 Tax=Pontibacter mangrovi TaxID=2589816 RepID=A0A501W7I7_9BACT|nr:GNAT family N-acetyltransferase [Pontibacter mangrovi]TPE45268.1 GNAT family N-acetyltransferase [Pontibacter mangrovi]
MFIVELLNQGKRLSYVLLQYLQERARQLAATRITLQARENAVNFYRRNGYEMIEKIYPLFGSFPHYLMARQL